MAVRHATLEDRGGIREIARRSMHCSYTMSPDTIDRAIEEWYGDETLEDAFEDDSRYLLVAEEDDTLTGFTDAVLHGQDQPADLLWLHVHPDHRGQGISRELLEETRTRLIEAKASHLRGLVLADNSEGSSFYEHFGFEKIGERHINIDGKRHVENVYQDVEPAGMTTLTVNDETVYVAVDDTEPGTIAPFNTVYADPNRDERWAYYCTNCDSVAAAMDAMARIECSDCGNTRKPTRWDAAYL